MLKNFSKKGATLRSALLAAGILAFASTSLASTPEMTGTLKKIKDEGVVVLGYREASIPFSYYDDAKQPIGYSIEYTNLLIERIKQALDLPQLKLSKLHITSQNPTHHSHNQTF